MNTIQRIAWVDSCRGIAFLMIIYGHLQFKNVFIKYYFTPVILTTFFFVSGYLFNKGRTFGRFFESRFRMIMIPFVIYGLLNIIASQILTFSEKVPIQEEIVDFLLQIRGNNDGLWFLSCLFVSAIPFYFFVQLSKNHAFLLAILSFLFIIQGMLEYPSYPWHIQLIIPANFYMALGYAYRFHENKFDVIQKPHILFLLLVLYFISVTLIWTHTGKDRKSTRLNSSHYS